MKTYLALLAILSLMTFATPSFAADKFNIDPAHSWLNFSMNHGGFAPARGRFGDVSGTIVFDQDNVTNSSVVVEIKTSSIDTNHEARNKHLMSPDFFNAAEFPTLRFKSTSIKKTGENTGIITGDLTMVGVKNSVTLDAVFNKADGDKVGFSATAKIVPGDFGMSKVAGFGMGPAVLITIDIEAAK
ncbi:MAG: polyisoprenoid-binding protein [Blastopirellula sp.]|nr:MAG: polyisoprenoid-binding protein [Blastopirellula sp.]